MPSRFAAFASAVVRFRGRIALAWVVASILLVPTARDPEGKLAVSGQIAGSETARVQRVLEERFGPAFAERLFLVLANVPSPDTVEGRRLLEDVVVSLDTLACVQQTLSYLDTRDAVFLGGAGRGTFVVVGMQPSDAGLDANLTELRRSTSEMRTSLRSSWPHADLLWTGERALNSDLRAVSSHQAEAAERRALPLTLVLLGLVFGAVGAAFLPVLSGIAGITLALGTAVCIGTFVDLSILLQNVVSMLGLGLGIDYALLMVSRFRQNLDKGMSRELAASTAAENAGHTIVVSGLAVGIGFAALLFVPLNELRSVAIGGLLVVTVSVLLATTFLPGVLAWLGPHIDFIRLRPASGSRRWNEKRLWNAWGNWVCKHSLLTLVVGAAPLAWLAVQATRIDTRLPRGDWLPRQMESARGLDALYDMGRGGYVSSLRVVLDMPPGSSVLEPSSWSAVQSVQETLRGDARIADVRAFKSADRSAALLEVAPREELDPNDLMQLVVDVRGARERGRARLGAVRMLVGGLPAFNLDYRDAVAGHFPIVVGFIVLGTFVALLAGFRSVLIAVKAVVLNLLSVAAAFGALVLVFQDGHGIAWVGLSAPMGGTFPAVPILVFCTVFGLSMDYEVFLVGRVAEARRQGASDAEALVEGLSRTGGIITSAAAIMIVVFGAFVRGEFLLIKMMGFALAVAVFLDATIVRIAVGPALLRIAGRWNWWPGDARLRTSSSKTRRPNAEPDVRRASTPYLPPRPQLPGP